MMVTDLMKINRSLLGLGLLVCEAKAGKGLAQMVAEWTNLPLCSGLGSTTKNLNDLLGL